MTPSPPASSAAEGAPPGGGVSPLVTAAELAALLGSAAPVHVLDVRWSLDRPGLGPADFAAAHVPGAVFVDLATELAEPGRPAHEGRHPLPSAERLQRATARWGLRAGDPIVVMDDSGGLAAARAWWLLRHAGVGAVRLLDGGLAAWRAAGGALETGPGGPDQASAGIPIAFGAMPVLDADSAAGLARTGVLVDARAAERYRGETEPIDPVAGHVPGAVSAPTVGNLGADGRFLDPAALRARFAGLGAEPDGPAVGVYCGSGVTAAHEVLALEVAGVAAALYPGSWSAWSNTPGRPVATGADPG
ncbi:MAG: sulfurtransferase [Actinomycetales bacterium]|nr:sulfurtransferase [Actinomycetales bacterium]